ncbi:MAG: Mbeg1-like protein, partial [Clostridium sp.]|uniref:Mbeg1-like protein n=1 Tax=Clostridium sp. TaxID=1506 RepID=UPI003EE55084
WKDWIDNAETAAKITAQQKDALSFVQKMVDSGNFESVQLGGHSKGGNLALFIAIAANEELRKKISDVATINTPGFRDSFIKDYKKVIDELNKNGVL